MTGSVIGIGGCLLQYALYGTNARLAAVRTQARFDLAFAAGVRDVFFAADTARCSCAQKRMMRLINTAGSGDP
ncbi:MAG: hypothetical protein ACKOB6_03350 [Candidatus Kapaibacterium sp.]